MMRKWRRELIKLRKAWHPEQSADPMPARATSGLKRSFNHRPSGGFEDAKLHREHGRKWKEPNTSANGIPLAQLYAFTSACAFALRSA